tara:strand:+ start:1583 stop:2134 length:552 start_codon:yes stop_codon:yes gene_type:complete
MGYKKVNRNFFKKKIQKGLSKYQKKGETTKAEERTTLGSMEGDINYDRFGNIITEGGLSKDDVMDTTVVDMPVGRGMEDPTTMEGGTSLSDEEKALLIQKQLDMMNFENMMNMAQANMTGNSVGNANLIEQGPTQNDIVMAAIESGKKVKFNKDGTIKKIKKTGGIARGKFLRQGGSTGRKFL